MKLALNGGFAAAVLILIFVGLVSVDSMHRLSSSQEWVAHSYEVREGMLSLMNDVSESSAGRRAYVITGQERFLGQSLKLTRTADEKIDALRKLTHDNPRQGPRLDSAS